MRAEGIKGVIDQVVDNTEDWDQVYYDVKEAIGTLSPIIRNRLHGLPGYVLDYSDLIAPNLVEKPFLKPVLITGPSTGERLRLMELLVHEFPDVFAFPRYTTTKPDNDEALYRVDAPDPSSIPPEEPEVAIVAGEEMEIPHRLPNEVLPTGEFAGVDSSGDFAVTHRDMFVHEMAAHTWGVRKAALRDVIKGGRLPLLECETDSAEAIKKRGIDCLTIFLKPPSVESYEVRPAGRGALATCAECRVPQSVW